MNLFRVLIEREGRTIKEPGVTETQLRTEAIHYAAASISEVWDAIKWIRDDPEARLIAVIDDSVVVNILKQAEPSA